MWPSITACSTSGGGLGGSGVASVALISSGRHGSRQPLGDPLGRRDVLAHPELLRLEAERQRDELWEVEDREPELATRDLRRLGLLQVEVQVAERAWRHQAVGAGVEGVTDVGARLAKRRVAVQRDHREAAAFAR